MESREILIDPGPSRTGANSIGSQGVNQLFRSLEPIYRQGAARYCTDDTVRALEGVLDKPGHPLVSCRNGLAVDGDTS